MARSHKQIISRYLYDSSNPIWSNLIHVVSKVVFFKFTTKDARHAK